MTRFITDTSSHIKPFTNLDDGDGIHVNNDWLRILAQLPLLRVLSAHGFGSRALGEEETV
jgi:hypothetical protein